MKVYKINNRCMCDINEVRESVFKRFGSQKVDLFNAYIKEKKGLLQDNIFLIFKSDYDKFISG